MSFIRRVLGLLSLAHVPSADTVGEELRATQQPSPGGDLDVFVLFDC